VAESLPVHEDMKRKGNFRRFIEYYKESIRSLGTCGIDTVTRPVPRADGETGSSLMRILLWTL
jgi:hypothetical protein